MDDINRIVPFENNSLKSILLTNRKNDMMYEIVDEYICVYPSSKFYEIPIMSLSNYAFIATYRSTVLFVFFFCLIIRNS